jgi:hypothetical protein
MKLATTPIDLSHTLRTLQGVAAREQPLPFHKGNTTNKQRFSNSHGLQK